MSTGFRQALVKIRVYDRQEEDFKRFLECPNKFILVPTGYRDGVDGEFELVSTEASRITGKRL